MRSPRAPSTRSLRSVDFSAGASIDKAKVAVVPGEAFGAPGYLRLSYALGDAAIEEGVRRLAELFATAE